MRSVCFAPSLLFSPLFPLFIYLSFNISEYLKYIISLLCTVSVPNLFPCSHCCPAIHPEIERALVAAVRESLPNPLIEKREELNQAMVGGWVCVVRGSWSIYSPSSPPHPPWEGRKPPPHQISSCCLLFPFHSQLCAVTFLVHTVLPLFPMITEIMKFAPRLLK